MNINEIYYQHVASDIKTCRGVTLVSLKGHFQHTLSILLQFPNAQNNILYFVTHCSILTLNEMP